ncbi:MAG: hypothetical protein JKX68_14055 [Flavobacteriales bacterium]|nr:hypothetical protein [Flavobacteriales bacterium]
MNTLKPGMYFYNINQNGKTVKTDQLIVE